MDGTGILLTVLVVVVGLVVLGGLFFGAIFLGEFIYNWLGATFGSTAEWIFFVAVWAIAAMLLVWLGFREGKGAVTYLACLFLIGVFEYFFSGTAEGNLVCFVVPIVLGIVIWAARGNPLVVSFISAGMCLYLVARFINSPQAAQVAGGGFALAVVLMPPAIYYRFFAEA